MKDKNGINKIDVKIQGKEYSLRGKETVGYLQSISSFVDEKLGEISETYPQLNTTMSAVLTAVNIADLYFKEKENLKDISEIKQLNEKLLDEKNRVHEIESDNRNLQSKLSEITSRNKELERKLLDLTEHVNEERNKTRENNENKAKNAEFQTRLEQKEDMINNLNGKVAALNHKYKSLLSSLDEKDKELKTAKEDVKKAKEELNEYIEEFDSKHK